MIEFDFFGESELLLFAFRAAYMLYIFFPDRKVYNGIFLNNVEK